MSAFTDPKAQQDLLRTLADTLVQDEVIDVMENRGWTHGDPGPYRKPEDNPTDSDALTHEASTTDTPAADNPPVETKTVEIPEVKTDNAPTKIDWESLRYDNGKILGKYNNEFEAVKGAANIVQMAKQAFTKAEKLEQELTTLRNNPVATQLSPITPITVVDSLPKTEVKSEKLAKVLAKLADDGGVIEAENLDALLEGFSEQASLTANQIVEQRELASKEQAQKVNEHWEQVSAKMEENYPGSTLFVDEMAVFIQSDPVVKAAVGALSARGDDYNAAALAWTLLQQQRGSTVTQNREEATKQAALEKKEIILSAQDQVRQEAVDEARKDAGIITSSAGGVHESPEQSTNQEAINAAAREMSRTGLGQRWRELTLYSDLPDAVFSRP